MIIIIHLWALGPHFTPVSSGCGGWHEMSSIKHQAHAKPSLSTHPFSKVNPRQLSWGKKNRPHTIKFYLWTPEEGGWEQQRERLGGVKKTVVNIFLTTVVGGSTGTPLWGSRKREAGLVQEGIRLRACQEAGTRSPKCIRWPTGVWK